MKNLDVNSTNTDNNFSIRKGNLNDLPVVLNDFLKPFEPDSLSYSVLEQMILRDKAVHNPLITADIDGTEVLIDGHMRLDILKKHQDQNIFFTTKKLNFISSKDDALIWMIENCNSYRRLNKAQRVKLVLDARSIYKRLAKANQIRAGKEKQEMTKQSFVPIHCINLLAANADVSKPYLIDAKYIFDKGNTNEQKEFTDEKVGAHTLRKRIEERLKKEHKKANENEAESDIKFQNPEPNKYLNQIIQGDCLKVLDDMYFDGIRDVVALIVSPPYNVGLEYDSDPTFDDMPYDEYLNFLKQMIYKAQLIGRDGMRICINGVDTHNRKLNEDDGNLTHNFIRDISNKIEEINKEHNAKLLYWGNINWSKQNSTAKPFMGSYQAPVLKYDSENILVWMKNQRKLVPQTDINCQPESNVLGTDEFRSKYVITKEEFMAWTYQTWKVCPSTEKVDHPAKFPNEIPHRLIKMFTYPKDGIVLDCCTGSGTVCEEAKKLLRDFVGIDISHKYCHLAKDKVEKVA